MAYKTAILQLTGGTKTREQLEEIYKQELGALGGSGIDVSISTGADEYNRDSLIKILRGVDIALCAGNPPLDRSTLEQLPDVKFIVRYGIGVNSIDLKACTDLGKLVYYMIGYCAEELAMHAVSLILGLLRNIAWCDRRMRKGEFPKGMGYLPRRLTGLTVGLFGLGDSGSFLAQILGGGFRSRVIAYDPFIKAEKADARGVSLVSFDDLLAQADIISVHAPLTPETHHIFNKEAFKKMKNDAMIINVSRGSIIDVDALIDALVDGEIGFAGLDVFEKEPLDLERDARLMQLEQVILTPHTAYYGKEASANQHKLAVMLVRDAVIEKAVHRRYVANKAVLLKFPGFRIMPEDMESAL
jgi:D-3-phosphoglycerate dehydrogenase